MGVYIASCARNTAGRSEETNAMATKTSKIKAGDRVMVTAGEFQGQIVTVVNPTTFPDSDLARRRKMTVAVDGEADPIYILPRLVRPVDAPVTAALTLAPAVVLPHPTTGAPVTLSGSITNSDDPRLDPWRPDPAIVSRYLSRTMRNGMTDVEFLLAFWERRENIVLVGDTQSGKTMMVEVLAVLAGARLGRKPLPIFTLSGSSGVSSYEIYGQTTAFQAEDGERLVFLRGIVDMAARCDHCILYLDELDHMSERVTSALHPVLDHRRQFVNTGKAERIVTEDGGEVFVPEVVTLSDGVWVVSTVNPNYNGNSLGLAVKNRFQHIPWDYDEVVESKLISSPGVIVLGKALREARAQRIIQTPIGTTILQMLAKNCEQFGPEMGLWMFLATFPDKEVAAVKNIIKDRSVELFLTDEHNARQAALDEAFSEGS